MVNEFPSDERFGLVSQLKRASSSITTNIAEGCGYETPKEFARFLKFASGSAFEVAYLLRLSKDLGFISQENFSKLAQETSSTRKMLYKQRIKSQE